MAWYNPRTWFKKKNVEATKRKSFQNVQSSKTVASVTPTGFNENIGEETPEEKAQRESIEVSRYNNPQMGH